MYIMFDTVNTPFCYGRELIVCSLQEISKTKASSLCDLKCRYSIFTLWGRVAHTVKMRCMMWLSNKQVFNNSMCFVWSQLWERSPLYDYDIRPVSMPAMSNQTTPDNLMSQTCLQKDMSCKRTAFSIKTSVFSSKFNIFTLLMLKILNYMQNYRSLVILAFVSEQKKNPKIISVCEFLLFWLICNMFIRL